MSTSWASRRDLPAAVDGYGPVAPFAGAFAVRPDGRRHAPSLRSVRPGERKVVPGLRELFRLVGVEDGMTLSFHHHLRDGDGVVNAVLATAAELGLRDLRVALSSVFPVHAPLVEHVRSGVVGAIDTDYMVGPVARAVSGGALKRPAVLRTHGGRARAIESGELQIDAAFVAAPAADDYGNLNGIEGPAACGSLGYAFPDAEHAEVVVGVTDHLVRYPLAPASISQARVDHVVELPRIGDPTGILSGTTRPSQDPARVAIAATAAAVIQAAGVLDEGFSYQTGAGGTSLAVTRALRRSMEERGIVGDFALGGITRQLVEMFDEGLFRRLLDVQDFDPAAVGSLARNAAHVEIGASAYANPHTSGCAVNRLACVCLGAIEVDTDFNVNVVTGSDGVVIGGSGGHSDASAGAGLTVVVAPLLRRGRPNVAERVLTVTTPGGDRRRGGHRPRGGRQPLRLDLSERLRHAGLPVKEMEELRATALRLAGDPAPTRTGERVVAVVEYRDGTVIDVVREAAV